MKILDSALKYISQGFSIVPSNPRTKAPMISWVEFQSRLASEDEITSWFRQNPRAMLGVVTGEFSGLTVVDADSPGAIAKIEDALPDSMEVPCVQTPRGGRHFYFSYTPAIPTRAGLLPNVDIRNDGGLAIIPPSARHDGKGYTWLGIKLSRENLQPMPSALASLLCDLKGAHINKDKHIYRERTQIVRSITGDAEKLFVPGRRDNDLFHLALTLKHAGESEEYIFQVLKQIALTLGDEFGEKVIWDKVVSAFRHEENKVEDISKAIGEWINAYADGTFCVRDAYECVRAVTRREKEAVRAALIRRVKSGILEKAGDKAGVYRKIDNAAEEIHWQDAKVSPLDVHWPFQIENLVRILPKNVIVVAGEPDAGKTAFLLNFVKLNMHRHEIFYFSSEMGKEELQDRISNFNLPFDEWRFKVFERAGNFADVIRPDSVNIIDYLEMSDDFYKVSGYIKAIFDKLENGIAVIALQKNRNTDYGLGGMRSLEKPRLYIAMEPGKAKIVKAKNWVDHTKNPNKLVIEYDLVKGCKFISKSGWKKE